MAAVPRIGVDQRRARLVRRHLLSPEARLDDSVDVARALVALHATSPASVHLSAMARVREPSRARIEDALYDSRRLVRVLGMRRTVFVVPREDAAVVLAACTRAVNVVERRRTVGFLAEAGIGEADPAGWLAAAEADALAAVDGAGEVSAQDLKSLVPRLAEQVVLARGKSYEGQVSLSSRVLPLLANDGWLVRGRPRGSWLSGQFAWCRTSQWLGEEFPVLETESARDVLARSWLRAFGPAQVADLKWWAGWTLRQTRAALLRIGAVEVDLNGTPGVALPDDLEPVEPVEPTAILLPELDPTTMGWFAREWYLGPHKAALFDSTGNGGATVWWDGRIVGGWAQPADTSIVVRLLEDVGAQAKKSIAAEVARLRTWLDGARVSPRFPSPLGREITLGG